MSLSEAKLHMINVLLFAMYNFHIKVYLVQEDAWIILK